MTTANQARHHEEMGERVLTAYGLAKNDARYKRVAMFFGSVELRGHACGILGAEYRRQGQRWSHAYR